MLDEERVRWSAPLCAIIDVVELASDGRRVLWMGYRSKGIPGPSSWLTVHAVLDVGRKPR
jgi:hypothetical protein